MPAELNACESGECAALIFHDERHRVGEFYVCDACRERVARELAIDAFAMGLAFGAAGGDVEHAEPQADVHEDLVAHFRQGFGAGARARIGNLEGYWKHVLRGELQKCRVCGCTEFDCSGCVARTGSACSWAEKDLCSACAPTPATSPERSAL